MNHAKTNKPTNQQTNTDVVLGGVRDSRDILPCLEARGEQEGLQEGSCSFDALSWGP